jgi:hypothetical protein
MNERVTGVGTASANMDVVTIGKVVHNNAFTFRPVLGSDNCQNVTLGFPHKHILLNLMII